MSLPPKKESVPVFRLGVIIHIIREIYGSLIHKKQRKWYYLLGDEDGFLDSSILQSMVG